MRVDIVFTHSLYIVIREVSKISDEETIRILIEKISGMRTFTETERS